QPEGRRGWATAHRWWLDLRKRSAGPAGDDDRSADRTAGVSLPGRPGGAPPVVALGPGRAESLPASGRATSPVPAREAGRRARLGRARGRVRRPRAVGGRRHDLVA